jgi:hypothetical protein
MRVSTCAVSLLCSLNAVYCHAELIRESVLRDFRFSGAIPGVQPEREPLHLGVEAGDEVVLLELGRYSSEDAGKTFTFTRDMQNNAAWNAIGIALRTPTNASGAQPYSMWLGLDEYESELSSFFLGRGFPTYNLQRVDITSHYYRRGGTDDGVTIRTAAFDARFYWLIPEPATWALAIGAAVLFAIRRG